MPFVRRGLSSDVLGAVSDARMWRARKAASSAEATCERPSLRLLVARAARGFGGLRVLGRRTPAWSPADLAGGTDLPRRAIGADAACSHASSCTDRRAGRSRLVRAPGCLRDGARSAVRRSRDRDRAGRAQADRSDVLERCASPDPGAAAGRACARVSFGGPRYERSTGPTRPSGAMRMALRSGPLRRRDDDPAERIVDGRAHRSGRSVPVVPDSAVHAGRVRSPADLRLRWLVRANRSGARRDERPRDATHVRPDPDRRAYYFPALTQPSSVFTSSSRTSAGSSTSACSPHASARETAHGTEPADSSTTTSPPGSSSMRALPS